MTEISKQAHEAAIDHGMWLAPDDDETNYQSFVAGYLRGHSDRGVEAASARDESDVEISTLRAKLASVPVNEIEIANYWLRATRGLNTPAANTIDRWLAGLK